MTNPASPKGKLFIVGFGPGNHDHLTFRAKEAIQAADVVIGYSTYIDLVRDLLDGKEVIPSGMQEEVGRAKAAIALAKQGKTVAVVSSGDAGVYGMAGLIYEVLYEEEGMPEQDLQVEVVPGVTAATSVASLVGAPLAHDFATISLSDLLTPLDAIYKRVEAAAAADFVIVLYNPKSGRRTKQIEETQRIIAQYRAPTTPVVVAKSVYREGEKIMLTDLAHLLDHEIGMLTTVIIGNSTTFRFRDLVVTPRGYTRKYRLEREEEIPSATGQDASG